MFGFFKRSKSTIPAKKLYMFEYHHRCMVNCMTYNTVQYGWVDAVNDLLGKKENYGKPVFIDKVDIKEIV